jgi:hypothetical protein
MRDNNRKVFGELEYGLFVVDWGGENREDEWLDAGKYKAGVESFWADCYQE